MKKSSEILVELRDESLEDYLKKMNLKELDLLYEKALMVTGEKEKKKIKKEEKIDVVFDDILSNMVASSFMLVDDDINQLRDILEGKKISSVSEKLLEGNYIFEEDIDGNIIYYIPTEIREIVEENIIDDSKNNDKKLLVIDFYLSANGVVKFDKLVELIKGTGFDIKVNELKKLVKSREYIVEDDKIYNNEFAYNFDKEFNLMSSKEEMDYRIFKMDEILAMTMMVAMMAGHVKNVVEKKIKNKDKLIKVVKDIFDIVSSNSEYEENIIIYLEENKIELTDKETDKLMESLLQVYIMMPSWELNGNIPGDHEHDCDCGCADDWDCEFEDLTNEEKIEVLVHSYLLINGYMEIDELVKILKLHHNINTNMKEIVNCVKCCDDLKVVSNYIKIDGLEKEEIQYMSSIKKMMKIYKVIDDIDLFYEEYDDVIFRLEDICCDYGLDEDVFLQLKSILCLAGNCTKEVIDEIFSVSNVVMNDKKKLSLLNELDVISKDVRVWCLNGFTQNELNEMNQNKKCKIGRNDMCPCGSGKKYKQCCGK